MIKLEIETRSGLWFHVFHWSQINCVVLCMIKGQYIFPGIHFVTQTVGEPEAGKVFLILLGCDSRGSSQFHLLGA